MKYDLVVIGAGPAGVSAAVYARSRGMKVLVLEKNKVGGIIGNVSTVTHYSGIIEAETGVSFAERLKAQLLDAGAELCHANVINVDLNGEVKKIVTEDKVYEAKAVIIANGSTPRKLDIPGEEALTGKGMRMNAARDAQSYKDKHVYVVGGADGAIKEAIYLAGFAKKVTIIHFEEKLGCISQFAEKIKTLSNVEVKLLTRLTKVMGETQVEKLELTNVETGEKQVVEDPGCGIFVYAGLVPNTELYKELSLENGFIPVNNKMETTIAGVYAAGDICVKQVRQVATAVSDGAIAGINACAYLGV